jgi:hypothetical protein
MVWYLIEERGNQCHPHDPGSTRLTQFLSTIDQLIWNNLTTLPRPYNLKEDTYPQGHFGQDLDILIGRLRLRRSPRPPDASPAISPRVPCFKASSRAWIPSLPAESLVLVLWLNQVTWRFCGELPQTPRADSGCDRHPAPAHVHDFVLLFLSPWGPHLIPFGHRVHRAKPTCLSTP